MQSERHRAVEDVPVRVEVRLGLAEIDPVIVGGERVERATGGDQLRERLAFDRNRATGRNRVEHLGLEQVRAGVHLVRRRLFALGLLDERRDPTARIVDDAAERRRVVDPDQVQAGDTTLGSVSSQHGTQVEARQHVAVEHEERTGDELLDVLERAAVPSGVSSIT